MRDPVFQWFCHDVLTTDTAKSRARASLMPHKIDESMARVCNAALKASRTTSRPALYTKGRSIHGNPCERFESASHALRPSGSTLLPYRSYMQITCLEMERARRNMERKSASQRVH